MASAVVEMKRFVLMGAIMCSLLIVFLLYSVNGFQHAPSHSLSDVLLDKSNQVALSTSESQTHSTIETQIQILMRSVLTLEADVAQLKKSAASFEAYKKIEWIFSIEDYDYFKEYSQMNTDSVLQFIFQNIGTTNKYYVEFGTENGDETNTRFLRERLGWIGLLMDGSNDNPSINLHQEMMTKNNIMDLFKKYSVPAADFDLLSVDIDYNTYWVWRAIDHNVYRPRVIVVEYSGDSMWNWETEALSVEDDPDFMWGPGRDVSNYYGANLKAMYELGIYKGYRLIYQDRERLNAFFLREDLIPKEAVEFLRLERIFRWGRQRNFQENTERKWVKVSPPAQGAYSRGD
ncbi:hypothetical protein BJ742DRAFT_844681 [Cladochytrium replicatum]|nr:hypothetical protein BJ742DRAFT_844681 [Cladochytrium replicatum]